MSSERDMSPPTTLLNNFIQVKETPKKSSIDFLSKIYIVIQYVIGVNRLRLLTKLTTVSIFSSIYVLSLVLCNTYSIFSMGISGVFYIPAFVKFVQYVLCIILSYTTCNKFQQYYERLDQFDVQAKYTTKINRACIGICFGVVPEVIGVLSMSISFNLQGAVTFIPLHLIQLFENHYYAYLFSLLTQRLENINDRVESSMLANSNIFASEMKVNVNNFDQNPNINMNVFMDWYNIINSAYDLLTDGISWQLVIIITTSFSFTLLVFYECTLELLSQNYILSFFLIRVALVLAEAVPLIGPCMCCDQLRQEVRRLRELLAYKLFESKLDKANRSAARALLALTKTNNLSFSLFNIVKISISLPFSILSLTVTYLIILLQFQKVVDPASHRFLLRNNATTV